MENETEMDNNEEKPVDFIQDNDVLGQSKKLHNFSETPQVIEQSAITNSTKIYSGRAIFGFSVFFSPLFGGVLLMQNLKDIGNKKAANMVLFSSILFTIVTIIIVNSMGTKTSSPAYLINMAGGAILSEYFFKKYFPVAESFEKKKIWKPLIISIVITIPFLFALIYSLDN